MSGGPLIVRLTPDRGDTGGQRGTKHSEEAPGRQKGPSCQIVRGAVITLTLFFGGLPRGGFGT